MAELFFFAWFYANWKIVAAVAISIVLIYATVKYNDSFDDDPEISPQERLKTRAIIGVWFLGLTFTISLTVSYLI